MKAAAVMATASVAAALVAIAIGGRQLSADVVLGMLAPLAATGGSWVLIERTFRRDPQQLTGLMIGAFGAKMLFFGAYVAVMFTVIGVHTVPFIASFTGYFIALYLTEALLMRRLFGANQR
jgi:hypothetical protein